TSTIALANIDVLLGLSISFVQTNGGLVSDTSIRSNGTALATFTHAANCNASSVSATVDTNPPPTVTTPITTLCPELSVIKTNNEGGSLPLSTGTWNWEVFVRNTGNGPATFADGQTILTDSLPSNHISYGSPTVGPATLRPNLSCNITNNVLTCAASGG